MKLGDVFLLVLLVIMWVTVSMHILELHELDGHTFFKDRCGSFAHWYFSDRLYFLEHF